jgi:hypothetical protein
MWTLRTAATLLVAAGALVIAASSAADGGRSFSVTSSLDGKKVLPLRTHWLGYTDLPPAQVDRVEFLIDGTVRWIERHAPYNYGADDRGKSMGYLITTWLRAGLHRFVVRVYDTSGHAEKDAFTARTVAGPAPPPQLSGTWQRTESAARAWRIFLWFDRIGAWYTGPFGPHTKNREAFVDEFDVRGSQLNVYGTVIMGVQEIEKGSCNGNGCIRVAHEGQRYGVYGFICNYSGPFGSYLWSVSGDTLTLKVIREGCRGRGLTLAGTWTRAR